MRKKLSLILVIIIFISTNFYGCYDSKEVDDQVYPSLLGIDKGTFNKLRITIQYPTYMASLSQSSDASNKSENILSGSNIHVVESPSIIEAQDLFQTEISRRVSYIHLKGIVISEDIAKDGMGYLLSAMKKYRDIRSSASLMVSRCTAENFIKENISSIGSSLPKMIELHLSQGKKTNYFHLVSSIEFYRSMLSNYEESIATYVGVNDMTSIDTPSTNPNPPLNIGEGYVPGEIPRNGIAKREFAGTAVFKGDIMVGFLDSYETRFYSLIRGKYKNGFMTIPDKNAPDKVMVFEVKTQKKPKIKVITDKDTAEINIELTLDADLHSIQSRTNYESLGMINDLNNQLKNYLEDGIRKTILKTQNEFKSDIFGFGYAAVNNFLTIDSWEEYDWLSKYPKADCNLTLNVNTSITGVTFKSKEITN